MTMIGNPQQQLAGAADLKILHPYWTSAPPDPEAPVEELLPGFLLRAREAVNVHPDNALAYARLAQAAQASRKSEEALDAARRAMDLGLDAGQVPAVHAAISVLEAEGAHRDLARLLDDRRAEKLPTNLRLRAAIGAGEYAAAIHLESDPQAASRISPDALALLAWVHLERGEFQAAVSMGRRAQAAGFSGVALYANLGYAHAALGQLRKAIKLTRQAQALAPLHRGVGLNLALYLKLEGDFEGASRALQHLRAGEQIDIQLALAMANLEVYTHNPEKARRLLQRVRASQQWATADTTRRSELEANLALLRWKTGDVDVHTTITSMRRALSATDYQSLSTAYLLADLLLQTEHAPLLEAVIDRLQASHQPEELYGLRMALALAQHDGPAAVDYARKWRSNDVLDPNAASVATYLVADLEGEFAEAAEIGLAGLQRGPSHMGLINNTAYALALSGRPQHARRLLDRLEGCERVEVIATRALVDLLTGQAERGLAGYRRAWELARSQNDEPLADRVLANTLLARARAGMHAPAIHAQVATRLLKAAESNPTTWACILRLERELSVHLDPASENLESDAPSLVSADPSEVFGLEDASASTRTRTRLPPGSR